jgi:hypothetical protein
MLKTKAYLVNPSQLSISNFNPRFYDPTYRFVHEKLQYYGELSEFLIAPPVSGSTPPFYFFKNNDKKAIPYIKTAAVSRDFINLNDLYYIHPDYHAKTLQRSIAQPNDVIFTMTGKFMGKAALVPPNISELNISQNSVILKTADRYQAAYLVIFLNSSINQTQIRGLYTIETFA